MSRLDLYYRAFKDYRKSTKNNIEVSKERKTIQEANSDLDTFKVTKFTCNIEEDWVNAIEKGLEYVQKALDEERQFITVNGEIVDIEKVKKVSKTSVEHLAKHANLITHLPEKEGDDMIPDKLYITEKLNDYAVYENRFLYMLLRYLEDFIYFRVNKIEQLRATYVGDFSIHKEIKTAKREVTYESKVFEKMENNPYPIPDDKTEQMLERIKNCQSIVSALLGTFLMQEVSKAPMLKPPVTKTNVLKMNNNFKNSLALYEYISTYKGLGYTYEEVVKDYVPFEFEDNDELTDSIALTSFLTYKLGNDLNPILEREYLEEERRMKEEEEKKLEERIRRLKKKALESAKSLEEYMVMLEQRNQQLLHDAEELALARNEIEKLNREIDKLNQEKEELYRRIDELNEEIEDKIQEIAYLNQKYITDMMALREKHEREIEELNAKHQEEILEIDKTHQAEIEDLKLAHENEIDEINVENAQKIREATREYEEKMRNFGNDYKRQIQILSARVSELEGEISKITTERNKLVNDFESKANDIKKGYEDMLQEDKNTIQEKDEAHSALQKDYDLIHGQLVAMRYKAGEIEPCDEFATRERFIQLERDFDAFEEFFKKQWKVTKAKIKKDAIAEGEAEVQRMIEEEAKEKEAKKKQKPKKQEEPKEEVPDEVQEAHLDTPIEEAPKEEATETQTSEPQEPETTEQENPSIDSNDYNNEFVDDDADFVDDDVDGEDEELE